MRIAITGVSGFLGSYIARQLHARGHRITGLVRPTSGRDHIRDWVDRFVVGDQADESAWPALLDGADCIIHNSVDLPGWMDPDDATLARHLDSNLSGSVRLLRASAPRQFVFISSCAVFHDIRPRWGGTIDEDHPTRPKSYYGAYKAAVEAHLWAEHYSHGRYTSAIRPCGIYGLDPRLDRSHGFDLVRAIRAGQPLRGPVMRRGGGKWVHVEDVAAAVAAVVGNPAASGRPYNLADCYARAGDWATMAAELLGVEADIDLSGPPGPVNTFSKEAARSLGIALDRGHQGIRQHLRALINAMGA